jgi:hypothetical protein
MIMLRLSFPLAERVSIESETDRSDHGQPSPILKKAKPAGDGPAPV